MSRRIGFLLCPDFQILDAAGPIAAFETASDLAAPLRSSSGIVLEGVRATGGLDKVAVMAIY